MRRSLGVLTLAFSAVLFGAAAADAVKEPETGQMFEGAIEGATAGTTLTLTGAACRKKTALGVKVYALGHWIDGDGAKSALSAWHGRTGHDLGADQKFLDAMSGADVEKRLRLVFVRGLEAKQIHDAFKESLDIVYSKQLSPAAGQFLALFTTDVKKGDTMELRSLPGGVVEVFHGGQSMGRVEGDPALAKAVWAIYFHETLADSYLEAMKPRLVGRFEVVW